tara:strand:+ start:1965 stop:2144 length:180 start_codon:yes stop_codon:yes gene_type:complete
MTGASHPALELDKDEFIWTVDQGEIANGAVSIAAVMKRELIIRTAESADFRIATNNHIK